MPFGLSRLVGADAAAAVGDPVAGRFLAVSTIVVALLTLSALWAPISIWPATVAILVTIVMAPAYGLAISVFLAPFRDFADLGPADFDLLHGIIWSATALRLAVMLRPGDLRLLVHSPTAIFVSLFAFVVVSYNVLPFDSVYYWMDAGFVSSVAVIVAVVATPNALPSYLPRLIVVAIFAGALLTIGFDIVLVYVPVPELAPPVSSLPPDRLRLAGLHANPLASGKFILVLGCMLAAGLIRTDREQTRFRNVATWSLFVIVAFALIATESKSTILAFLISLLVMTLVTFRTETITVRSAISAAKVGIAFLAAIVLWALVLAPPIKHHAATAWLGSSNIAQRADLNELRPDLNELAGLPRDFRPSKTRLPVPAEPATSGLLSQFLSEFRVGKSYRLQARTEDLDSPLKSRLWDQTETERHCGVSCTGQRDLLWNAGLKVLREHWLMGIGFGGWKRVLNEKLGFPFDHPHLGLVEVWGEFGILGLAMYLTLVLFLIVRARHAIQAKAAGFEKWFLIGTSMAALALLSNELFDTSKFFSVSPHAIWIWALLALQERYLRQPLTWSASVRWLSFLADKIKHPQSAASPIRSSP